MPIPHLEDQHGRSQTSNVTPTPMKLKSELCQIKKYRLKLKNGQLTILGPTFWGGAKLAPPFFFWARGNCPSITHIQAVTTCGSDVGRWYAVVWGSVVCGSDGGRWYAVVWGSVVYTANLQSLFQPHYTKQRNSKHTLQK